MTSSRCVLASFDLYQKSKLNFLQSVYDYCLKKEFKVDQLVQLNVIQQVLPLLEDVPNVQSLALITTAKLSALSKEIAQGIIKSEILTRLSKNFEEENKDFKRNVIHLTKSVSKHNDLAIELFDQTSQILKSSLQNLDTTLKETTLSILTNIAGHSNALAHRVLDLDILPRLLLCLQQPVALAVQSTQLVRIMCRQSKELLTTIFETNALNYLVENLQCSDTKLIKHTFLCLADVAKHSPNYAEKIINDKIISKAILHTSHPDISVKRSTATLLRELCKQNVMSCKIIVEHGGLVGLVNLMATTDSSAVKLPAIMALGYIAAQSDHLALAIIQSNGLTQITSMLSETKNDTCLNASLWTLEQITKHSVAHMNHLKNSNVFGQILKIYISPLTCNEIRSRCLSTLNTMIAKCMTISELELLLYESPTEILQPTLQQLCKIFPVDPRARRVFVSTGGLKKIQHLTPEPGSELSELITILNSSFPEEIVRYYSPHYPDDLLTKVEKFTPVLPSNLVCATSSSTLGPESDLEEYIP